VYMRKISCANSEASSPPVPARISSTTFLSSSGSRGSSRTFNSASNPAARGAYVAFWLTGQGLVNTTLADGAQPASPPFPTPMLPVSVSLGGVAVPAGNIAFDGLVYSGEVQINLLIPANAPTGNAVPLVVTIGAASSRSDAAIAIR